MSPAEERAAFESWAGDYGRVFRERDGDGYAYPYTQEAWVGWQARAALAGGDVRVTGIPLDRLRALVRAAHEIADSIRQSGPVDARHEASNLCAGIGNVDELVRDLTAALAMAQAG